MDTGPSTVSPAFPDVTLGMISWKAHRTVAGTLASYERAGILDLFAARLLHFNEISDDDREIAQRHNFGASGSPLNLGIHGAVDVVAARVTTPYVLMVENDCPVIAGRNEVTTAIATALSDMKKYDIPVFSLRSRRQPGDKFDRRTRYEKKFRVVCR